MNNKLLSLLFTLLLAGCGSASPSLPAQLPTSVEYMGETVGGDVVVQTSKTAEFVAKDANGDIVDPTLVIVEIVDNSGTVLDYGTVSTSGNLMDILNDTHFPNTESQYVANFYAADTQLNTASKDAASTPIATFPIKVSVSEDDFESNTTYTFTDPITVYSGRQPIRIGAALTEDNIFYSCYRDISATGESFIYVSRKLDAYSTTFEGPFTAIEYDGTTLEVKDSGCGIAAMDSTTRGSETVAVAWLVYDVSYNSDCGVVDGCQNYYHYVGFSHDGGQTFGIPVLIHHANIIVSSGKSPNVVSTKFDSSELLHVVYASSTDGENINLYYASCTSDTCNAGTQINTASDSLDSDGTTSTENSPIGIYNNSDGATTIYTAWIDKRNAQPIPGTAVYSRDIYAAKILKTGDTVSVANELKISTESDVQAGAVDLAVDREGNPVFTWTQLAYGGSLPIDAQAYLVKSIDGLASTRNIIFLNTLDAVGHYSYLSRLTVDASNYYHITFLYGAYDPVTGLPEELAVAKNLMSHYESSDSGTDTLEVTTPRDIFSNLSITHMNNITMTSDSAGRSYLLWITVPGETTITAIEGNINSP